MTGPGTGTGTVGIAELTSAELVACAEALTDVLTDAVEEAGGVAGHLPRRSHVG
ncbi:hypothetical protein [Saccharothrix sp. NRRL B-16348]|uniref:hypothetical protein n=1 Tax=Saccharothrix sp. NRRL B-16348 TaxID=1415542 RepID=UPI000AA0B58F|nr:hypothetical protein [Saccharothrix sp. NRRL B-16348]